MKKESTRVIIDVIIIVLALILFGTNYYQVLPPALQVDTHKMLIVSISVLIAHFVGRRIVGTVDWNLPLRFITIAHLGRLLFYAIIPISYALCG